MRVSKKTWLGQPDSYARLRRIESLDIDANFREIAALFYQDFQSVMLPASFSNFMMTFAAPRISRILGSTGELEHRAAKRVVDMSLLTSAVLEHGLGAELGRDAARRVNHMHRQYDIHEDDFLVVGSDAVVIGIALAENYGWRAVTDKEREAVRRFHSQLGQAFGSHRPLPGTLKEVRQFWSDYMDRELQFEPQNRRLARAVLNYYITMFPKGLRTIFRVVLMADVDPRIARACGMPVANMPTRWIATRVMKLLGRQDPVPDGGKDGLAELAKTVYPNGWEVNELGTHIQAKVVRSPEPAGA
jgi:ER-bound oxygenase mpaB/B'/Rubber oxygenase, catalytic domain